jgi:nitroreductase
MDPPAAALGRRKFLVLVGGAAAWQFLSPGEAVAKKLAAHPPSLQPWSLPEAPPENGLELAKAVIGAAVLAPSHWNTQPWRMETEGDSIRLVADPSRSLPVLDPDQRSMFVALGAALENMLIALRAYGCQPNVEYLPDAGPKLVAARVTWTAGESRRDRQLFAAIPLRRTNRRDYDERGLYMQNRAALSAQLPSEVRVHWIEERKRIDAVSDLVRGATEVQVEDRRAQAEQYAWMRFDNQARKRGDGIAVDDLEYGGPALWFAGRTLNPNSMFGRFGQGSAVRHVRGAVRSSGALALLTIANGNPRAWIAGGQAFERFALRATSLGIAHQPVHAPIEVTRFRGDLVRAFGAVGQEPLLLVRLGHAKSPDPSVRRGVSMIASFRSS